MARSRKPLIEPGSVLPPSDTLSRILERDRTRSGRRAPSDVLEAVPASDRMDASAYAHITSNTAAQPAALVTAMPDAPTPSQPTVLIAAPADVLQAAHISALQDAPLSAQPDVRMEARVGEQPAARSAAQPEVREVSNAAGHLVTDAAAAHDAARMPIADDSTTGDKERRAALQQRAYQLAATRLIPITLRLPEGLNDWLDDYAHEHRKEGIKKQDLISRAVQLLVMEAEGGRE